MSNLPTISNLKVSNSMEFETFRFDMVGKSDTFDIDINLMSYNSLIFNISVSIILIPAPPHTVNFLSYP